MFVCINCGPGIAPLFPTHSLCRLTPLSPCLLSVAAVGAGAAGPGGGEPRRGGRGQGKLQCLYSTIALRVKERPRSNIYLCLKLCVTFSSHSGNTPCIMIYVSVYIVRFLGLLILFQNRDEILTGVFIDIIIGSYIFTLFLRVSSLD